LPTANQKQDGSGLEGNVLLPAMKPQ